MQEVFEKIIEKLEELNTIDCQMKTVTCRKWDYGTIVKAIEIVKHEAEKYNNGHFGCNTNGEHEKCNGCGLTDCKNRNKIWFGVSDDNNGWILCSDRLPKNDCYCLVTTSDMEIGIREYGYSKGFGWDGFERIIAWQPLPQPYQPKGE